VCGIGNENEDPNEGVNAMKVIAKPKEEKELLIAVSEEAKPKDVQQGIIAQGQCCVDHLCGCNCSC